MIVFYYIKVREHASGISSLEESDAGIGLRYVKVSVIVKVKDYLSFTFYLKYRPALE